MMTFIPCPRSADQLGPRARNADITDGVSKGGGNHSTSMRRHVSNPNDQ